MVDDSLNRTYLDSIARVFGRFDAQTLEKYRGASIQIHPPVTNLNDSTTRVIYSNSYTKTYDTLQVLRRKDNWLVDLKNPSRPKTDSIQNTPK